MQAIPETFKYEYPLLGEALAAVGEYAMAQPELVSISGMRKDAKHPCYDEEHHCFEWGEFDDEYYLANLNADGYIGIVPNGFDMTTLETTVGNAVELKEFLAWYDDFDENTSLSESSQISLDNVLIDFNLLVNLEGEPRQLPLNQKTMGQMPDSLLDILWQACRGNWIAANKMVIPKNLKKEHTDLLREITIDWNHQNLLVKTGGDNMEITLNPLFAEKATKEYLVYSFSYFQVAVAPGFSWMYVTDFINHTLEGQEALRDCFLASKSLEDFFQQLGSSVVDIPRTKATQVAKSIEWRVARTRYRQEVENIPRLRANELTSKFEQESTKVWATTGLLKHPGF
jgi:hypothetical protein